MGRCGAFEAAGRAPADAKLELFGAEDEAGPSSAPYVTVDDTSARHAGKNGYTTQIGSASFFRVSHWAGQVAPRLSVAALRLSMSSTKRRSTP
jgi:hypothetical protein